MGAVELALISIGTLAVLAVIVYTVVIVIRKNSVRQGAKANSGSQVQQQYATATTGASVKQAGRDAIDIEKYNS